MPLLWSTELPERPQESVVKPVVKTFPSACPQTIFQIENMNEPTSSSDAIQYLISLPLTSDVSDSHIQCDQDVSTDEQT